MESAALDHTEKCTESLRNSTCIGSIEDCIFRVAMECAYQKSSSES